MGQLGRLLRKSDMLFLMNSLMERERLVLSLYYVEKCNFREIALILRLPEMAVMDIFAEAVGVLIGIRFPKGEWSKKIE
jgi:DNA-directed RNA polymerase specialized sigma subunit